MAWKRMALGIVFAAAFAGAAQAETLRIGTEGAYPPFNMIDEKGELTGFDVDIARALCAEMQVECELVTQDWDGIIPALLNRKFDAIVASMSITEERKRAVDFTDPYYSNKLQFIARKDSDFMPTPEGMKGKVIGAQRATIAGQWLEDNLGGEVGVKLYDTQENAYLDLSSGRLDAMLADKFVNYDWLQSEAGRDFEFKGEPVYDDDKIAIAVRKGDDELRQRLNQALKAILENGTYEKINAKYFPFSIY